ncbi:MAG: MoaD/ThiS family protein [Opitutales bacterium]
MAGSKQITLTYFALLREQRGLGEESVTTPAPTVADLYGELAGKHGFTLQAYQLKVAINGDFAPMDHPLADGDAVVFIPPVAGG